jgi:uncharacterized protein YbjT (DUF2867 family)
MNSSDSRVLVTGVPGRVGGVGSAIVDILRRRELPVRALVLREDQRTDALRANGVDVVVGDLTQARDVAAALAGCRRMYFGMSVSPSYLEATVTTAAVARERPDLEVLVNISQMTVSQMSLTEMTDSPQQRQQWLGEQVLNWSGLPVVNVRPTVFLQHPFFSEWAAESIARDSTIRLPFRTGRTSPIDASDVAEVIATILASPATILARSTTDRTAISEYAWRCRGIFRGTRSAHRYVDVPFDQWRDQVARTHDLSGHVSDSS